MTDTAAPMRSGVLARLTGVSTDTLRFYERRGLLPKPPRESSGYRRYPPAAIARVRLIRRALDAGFTIDDLARILKQRDAGGAPCREVLDIATKRLGELEARIADLRDLHQRLRAVIGGWARQLAATPAGQRARLLDALAAHDLPGPRQASIRRMVK
jgi:DNA-binding transcriptional MerR regulator